MILYFVLYRLSLSCKRIFLAGDALIRACSLNKYDLAKLPGFLLAVASGCDQRGSETEHHGVGAGRGGAGGGGGGWGGDGGGGGGGGGRCGARVAGDGGRTLRGYTAHDYHPRDRHQRARHILSPRDTKK